VHLGFLLSRKRPKTLYEAYNMVVQIESNIFWSKGEHIFSLGTKINDPEGTPVSLSLEGLDSLETFTIDFQEEGEQVIDQQNAKGKDLDEFFQPCREEKGIVEDTVEEPEPKQDDETKSCPPLSDESIHEPFPPAQEETNTVSYPPLQNIDDSLLYDLGNEEEIDEPSNVSNHACYDTDRDMVDNIDEFIHVGDVNGMYLVMIWTPFMTLRIISKSFLHSYHDRLLLILTNVFTDIFKTPKVDLVPYFPDGFRSYLEGFDEYSSKNLDSFHEGYFQPPLCLYLDRSKDIVCLKKDSCDSFLQPPLITLPCCVIKGVVGNMYFVLSFL
jgi:hypothetical protein